MNTAGLFFGIFVTTVLVVRIFLHVKPTSSPTILGIRLHHWMYGAVGIPIALLLSSLPLYAISVGLFIDELTYILIGGKTHENNYSKVSLLGTSFLVILVFVLREYLVSPFN